MELRFEDTSNFHLN